MSDDPECRQLCTFRIDGLLFGVEITHVQEVLRAQPMTPVPLANAAVRGLINLRGQIVTALDLRYRLGLAALPPGVEPVNIVVRVDGGVVSLLVDEIGDVLDVDASCFESAPETLPPSSRDLIQGVFKLSSDLLLVLDSRAAARIDSHGARPKE
jgi:purine-binding chemotaxis protein CheW